MSNNRGRSKRILFLCTGNYFRSRFSEIWFNHRAAGAGFSCQAISRGLGVESAANPGPMSQAARQTLETQGVSTAGCERYPLPVTVEDMEQADWIVALKEVEHRPLLRERFPDWENRVEYWHVHDLDCAPASSSLQEIQDLIEKWIGDHSHSYGPEFGPAVATVYKILPESLWKQMEERGELDYSVPVDAKDGFIHLSTSSQVRRTAAKYFAGLSSLMLVAVDVPALGSALRFEPSTDGILFPHLYGILSMGAVRWAKPLPLGSDGTHCFECLEP